LLIASGENGGMALELRFPRNGYDGSAIGTPEISESLVLDRVHPPFEDTGDPNRRSRELLDDGQIGCSTEGNTVSQCRP
jgi:hypothetical protein